MRHGTCGRYLNRAIPWRGSVPLSKRVLCCCRSRIWSLEHILSKNRDRLSQALPFKSFQILGHRLGRLLQALAMIFRRCHHSPRSQVEEMKDEFVWVLGFNSKRSDGVGRKVPQVYRHDDVCMAANRSRQYMSVVRIGEL